MSLYKFQRMSFFDFFNAEMRQLKSERDWLRGQVDSIGKELKAERRRNLKREDELTNQILKKSGGRDLPLRFDDEGVKLLANDNPGVSPEGLTQSEVSTLRARARLYCEQKSDPQTPTAEEIEAVFQQMLDNPDHWLND